MEFEDFTSIILTLEPSSKDIENKSFPRFFEILSNIFAVKIYDTEL